MPLVTGNESGTKWGRLRRLSEVLRSQGMQASQQVTFLTDRNLISRIKRGHAVRAGRTGAGGARWRRPRRGRKRRRCRHDTLAVLGEMNSSAAISRLPRPAATRRSTSSSRPVSPNGAAAVTSPPVISTRARRAARLICCSSGRARSWPASSAARCSRRPQRPGLRPRRRRPRRAAARRPKGRAGRVIPAPRRRHPRQPAPGDAWRGRPRRRRPPRGPARPGPGGRHPPPPAPSARRSPAGPPASGGSRAGPASAQARIPGGQQRPQVARLGVPVPRAGRARGGQGSGEVAVGQPDLYRRTATDRSSTGAASASECIGCAVPAPGEQPAGPPLSRRR